MGSISHVRLTGVIDETFSPQAAREGVSGYVVYDLGQVEWISSFGVRKWVELVATVPPDAQAMYAINVPAVFVDQLNMVVGFGGAAQVLSALAPYNCDTCNEERVQRIDLHENGTLLHVTEAPTKMCPVCKSPMELADPASEFFAFTQTQESQPPVPPEVVKFLGTLGTDSGTESGKEESSQSKAVIDDVTWFSLRGQLGGDLSTRRLTAGVEGRVVYDLGAISTVEPAGVLKLVEVLSKVLRGANPFLWRVPLSVLSPLAARTKPLPAPIATISLGVTCPRCGHHWSESAVSATYLAQLSKPQNNKRKCGQCGGEAQLPVLDSKLAAFLGRVCPAEDIEPLLAMEKRAHEQLEASHAGPQPGAAAPGARPASPPPPAAPARGSPSKARAAVPETGIDRDFARHRRQTRFLVAGFAVLILGLGAGAAFLFGANPAPGKVKVLYLDRDERLYLDGLLADPANVTLEKQSSVVLVGKDGKLIRFGTPSLDGELDVRSLALVSQAMDLSVRATVDIKTDPAGCAVAIGDKPLPTKTPTVTTIQSGQEFDFAISCPGRSVWRSKLLAIPGEYIEATVTPRK